MKFKVVASDFDGTLFRDENITAEDIAAIKTWQAAGNKFGIVTGRCYPMLTSRLKDFDVAIDFAICDNGAIIFDGNERIIFESEIPTEMLLALLNEPCVAKSFHFLFEAADETFCVNAEERSWILREKINWKNFLTFTDAAQVAAFPKKINQLALGFDTADEAQLAAKTLNRKFGEQIYAQSNTYSLDIVTAGLNKSVGVENLLEIMNWRGAKIFVIGDESNDLPMIKHFGGCTVSTAKEYVRRQASAVFDSVGAMLNHFA